MSQFFSNLWTQHGDMIVSVAWKIALVLIVFIACRITSLLGRKSLAALCKRYERFDETLLPVSQTALSILIYAIGTVIVLDLCGFNTGSLIAVIGAAGLAIGLALQGTLSNVAAGVMLLILSPFRVNDYVDIGTTGGTVRALTLFTVVLETFDGLYVSIPNSVAWGANITNYTRNKIRRVVVTIGIACESDIEQALAVLRKLATSEKRFLADPAPFALVTGYRENAIDIALRGWTTVEDYWDTLADLNRLIKPTLNEAGISTTPKRALRVVAASTTPPATPIVDDPVD